MCRSACRALSVLAVLWFVCPQTDALALQIPLETGWNLISIPGEPVDPSPAAVFAGIDGAYEEVWAYDACDVGDPWKRFLPGDPGGSDLTQITPQLGLFVRMASPATLDAEGVVPASPQLALCQGWNLIGHPRDGAMPVRGNLLNIDGSYQTVYGFARADTADPWEVYDVSAPAWTRDLAVMTPGVGYWIFADAATDLTWSPADPPPAVDPLSLLDGQEITWPVLVSTTVNAVGTVDWQLQYRFKDAEEWISFASGDTELNTLAEGTFDPTLLKNGMYEVRLVAEDVFGQVQEQVVTVLVEGQAKVGYFRLEFLEMAFPVPGTAPLEVIRAYDNRDTSVGDFGHGWNLFVSQATYRNNRTPGLGWFVADAPLPFPFPCSIPVETATHYTEVRLSDEEVYRFAFTVDFEGSGSIVSGGCDGSARFEQIAGPPGAELFIQESTTVHWPAGGDELLNFERTEIYSPENVLLVTAEGFEVLISRANGVRQIRDPNGNTVDILPNGLIHSSGRTVFFERDDLGRITEIIDPAGNSFTYTYDEKGDLIEVENRTGGVSRYTYDNDHNLVDLFDPRGVRVSRSEYDEDGRLVALINADGNRVEIDHDLNAQVDTIQDLNGGITVVEYDQTGNVLSRTDAAGGVTEWTYDAEGNILTRTDAEGRVTVSTWDSRNNLLTRTNPENETTTYTWTLRNQPKTVTSPEGRTVASFYDNNTGNLVISRDALNRDTTFSYDLLGNLDETVTPGGAVTSREYDSEGQLETFVGPGGVVQTYTYDANGNPISVTSTYTDGNGDPVVSTETNTYDAAGRLTSTTNGAGVTTYREYDAAGNMVAVVNGQGLRTEVEIDAFGREASVLFPDGTQKLTTYDAAGNRISATDPQGSSQAFTYDPMDRITRIDYSDGSFETKTYDLTGRLLSETDRAGSATGYAYDGAGRLLQITDALGNTVTNTYDDDGNLLTETDQLGRVTARTYDAVGQEQQTTWPDLTTRDVVRDDDGRAIEATDELGRTYLRQYDSAGRMTSVTNPGNVTAQTTYNERGSILTTTDPLGQVTKHTYDAAGRRTARMLPEGMSESVAYDFVGRVISRTNFGGETTTYTFDDIGRLSETGYADGDSMSVVFDSTGRPTSRTDSSGTVSVTYDANSRIASLTGPDGDTVTYAYDAAGRVQSVAGPGGATSYTYDALSRTQSVTGPDGGVTTYTYDAVDNLTRVDHANGTRTEMTYDSRDRLMTIAHLAADDSTLSAYTYVRDALGRKESASDHEGRVVSYTYDLAGRLIEEAIVNPGDPSESETLSYTYDAAGNRLTQTNDDGVTTYVYDENNRLVSATVPGGGQVDWVWGADGRLQERSGALGTATWQWDARERLTAFSEGGETVNYSYDPNGDLVGYEYAGETRRLLPERVLGLSRTLEERDGGGVLLAQHELAPSHARTIRGADMEVWHRDGPLGSVRALTDGAGAVTDTALFDAFGNERRRTGTSENPYWYRSERRAPFGEQVHLRSRWLDPSVGRFVTGDSYEAGLERTGDMNRYLYASSDPINMLDPAGTTSLSEISISLATLSVLSTVVVPGITGFFSKLTGGNGSPVGLAHGVSLSFSGNGSRFFQFDPIPLALGFSGSSVASAVGNKALDKIFAKGASAWGTVTLGFEEFAHASSLEVGRLVTAGTSFNAGGFGIPGVTATIYNMAVFNVDSLDDYASRTSVTAAASIGLFGSLGASTGIARLGGGAFGAYFGWTLGSGGPPFSAGATLSGSTLIPGSRKTGFSEVQKSLREGLYFPPGPNGLIYSIPLMRRANFAVSGGQ